ncbi:hypothetical protein J6590_045553 [Homalodisca vitripennis]|nr:hypothetical protein J6590_045553 [Homalodisca vitripennis]
MAKILPHRSQQEMFPTPTLPIQKTLSLRKQRKGNLRKIITSISFSSELLFSNNGAITYENPASHYLCTAAGEGSTNNAFNQPVGAVLSLMSLDCCGGAVSVHDSFADIFRSVVRQFPDSTFVIILITVMTSVIYFGLIGTPRIACARGGNTVQTFQSHREE